MQDNEPGEQEPPPAASVANEEPVEENKEETEMDAPTLVETPPVTGNSVAISDLEEEEPTPEPQNPTETAAKNTPPAPQHPKRGSAVASARQAVAHTELTSDDSSALQAVFRENEQMKEKVAKLKGLLGRSAKAQRESKVELESTTKKLEAVKKENERLTAKIDKLASRPTHMELLQDFETNFDKAMIAVNQQVRHQSGGQDTASAVVELAAPRDSIASDGAVVDSLLMQELSESRQRVAKLEKLNNALVHRSSQLETDLAESKRSMDNLLNKLSNLDLEKRMAVMEAEHATKAMQEKAASLEEMQLEINLLSKSAQKATLRAAAGEELMKSVKSDKQMVAQLEERVKVLQEWAIASNEAKTLAQERVRLLEHQVRRYQGGSQSNLLTTEDERIVLSKKGSMVVGAGDTGCKIFTLDSDLTLNPMSERVVLRWTFDLTNSNADIYFNIYRGQCESKASRVNALIKDRYVKGGAGGETDNAFDVQRSCTLAWSNNKSWIKPRTVKYTVDAVIIQD